ncbi:hypothetical protein [Nocardia rhizosphaerae]|uniref:Uncharacterized protein n=1 Tax=Nocardia rhizosphaerae TaxID=1691571 RepID=A0ABV8L337_9NOCA
MDGAFRVADLARPDRQPGQARVAGVEPVLARPGVRGADPFQQQGFWTDSAGKQQQVGGAGVTTVYVL